MLKKKEGSEGCFASIPDVTMKPGVCVHFVFLLTSSLLSYDKLRPCILQQRQGDFGH